MSKFTFSLNESRKIAYSIKTQQKLHNSEKTPATNSPPSIMKYAIAHIFSIAFLNLIFETSCSYICS